MPNRTYAKDLFHVSDDLRRVVLVDNNCNSFALQKSNGVPISSFYDDPKDIALTKLMKFLKYLTNVRDVRPRLKDLFNVCEVPRSTLIHRKKKAEEERQQRKIKRRESAVRKKNEDKENCVSSENIKEEEDSTTAV